MNPSQASRTALATSLMRALHSRSDPAPLLDDPWGDRLVPEPVRAAFRERALGRLDAATASSSSSSLQPEAALDAGLRANAAYPDVILRSRYTEDALKDAVNRGIRQYVIVGAGPGRAARHRRLRSGRQRAGTRSGSCPCDRGTPG
jgi:O-methyltransferase involved in polyketide biosynthesis